jgi:hypothetical protein
MDYREYEKWVEDNSRYIEDSKAQKQFERLRNIENILFTDRDQILELRFKEEDNWTSGWLSISSSDEEGYIQSKSFYVGQCKENISIEKDQVLLEDGELVYVKAVKPGKQAFTRIGEP